MKFTLLMFTLADVIEKDMLWVQGTEELYFLVLFPHLRPLCWAGAVCICLSVDLLKIYVHA
jgi:hypothetical protein